MTGMHRYNLHPARPLLARITLVAAMLTLALAAVSAHVVTGVLYPSLATAFVSSPSATQDTPIKILWGATDTGVRVVCFNVANTSPARADDPDWPRVTAVGFELPGRPTGFTLLEPHSGWSLVEGTPADIPGNALVSLDLAIVAPVNPAGWAQRGPNEPSGIPPGQQGIRGNGTRFCVSGPFPDTLPSATDPATQVATTIEHLLNGVVVRFDRLHHGPPLSDVGVWANGLRTIPLY
jgi:hypothetical protein